MKGWKQFAGIEGAVYYYYGFPKNKVNDWLVAEHKKRFGGAVPDFFTAGGMAGRHRDRRSDQEGRLDRHGEADCGVWKACRSNRPREL
jgi:hypothetical protein